MASKVKSIASMRSDFGRTQRRTEGEYSEVLYADKHTNSVSCDDHHHSLSLLCKYWTHPSLSTHPHVERHSVHYPNRSSGALNLPSSSSPSPPDIAFTIVHRRWWCVRDDSGQLKQVQSSIHPLLKAPVRLERLYPTGFVCVRLGNHARPRP